MSWHGLFLLGVWIGWVIPYLTEWQLETFWERTRLCRSNPPK
jgi:hypothetical protein